MFTIKMCVSLFLLVGLSSLAKGSLLINYPFDGYGNNSSGITASNGKNNHQAQQTHKRSWHRHNFLDFVNWDPFDDDWFGMDFFHNHDLYFPRIHRALGVRHVTAAQPLVKRNDHEIFQLSMDVRGFDPNEISVKLEGRELLIKGFHSCDGKQDSPCFRRRFCWRRKLPADVDLNSVKATLTRQNTLEIEATKIRHNEVQDIQIDMCEKSIEQSLPAGHNHEEKNQNAARMQNMSEHNLNKSGKGDDDATVEIVPDENLNSDHSY